MRGAGVALLLAALVAGCGGEEPSKPSFGGGSGTSSASDRELAALKAAAKIEDCPKTEAVPAASPDVGLPALKLECLGGGPPVVLSALTGKPTVINLWASWCSPCRDELPLLARADREYGDRLQVIGIDVADAAPEAAIRLADRSGVTYPQLVDRAGRTRTALRFSGLPLTVLVDAQGRMVSTERAPFRSYADVKAAIRRHLGVTP